MRNGCRLIVVLLAATAPGCATADRMASSTTDAAEAAGRATVKAAQATAEFVSRPFRKTSDDGQGPTLIASADKSGKKPRTQVSTAATADEVRQASAADDRDDASPPRRASMRDEDDDSPPAKPASRRSAKAHPDEKTADASDDPDNPPPHRKSKPRPSAEAPRDDDTIVIK